MKKYDVCIVGATGLVGQTFLKVLEDYDFPINRLKPLASKRSAGKKVLFKGEEYEVEELTKDSFEGYDLALFSAGGGISLEYAPIAKNAGLVVIDNSSAWREHPELPLVVPEVNFEDVELDRLIANPNCSTIQSILPVKALADKYGVSRVVYSTYQAVSGSGQKGRDDLTRTLNGENPEFYPHNISQTAIPEIDVYQPENGYTKEEIKMVNETRKMLHKPDLAVSATCIRIPVLNGHGVSILVELEQDFEMEEVRQVLSDFDGIVVVDNVEEHEYPTSILANGKDDVFVGRIRRDLSNPRGVLLYCVADNVRKGAAANAVQIAVKMAENNLI